MAGRVVDHPRDVLERDVLAEAEPEVRQLQRHVRAQSLGGDPVEDLLVGGHDRGARPPRRSCPRRAGSCSPGDPGRSAAAGPRRTRPSVSPATNRAAPSRIPCFSTNEVTTPFVAPTRIARFSSPDTAASSTVRGDGDAASPGRGRPRRARALRPARDRDDRLRRQPRRGCERLGRRGQRVPRLRGRDRLPEPGPQPGDDRPRDPRAGRPLPAPVLHGRHVRAVRGGLPPARRPLARRVRDEVDARQLGRRGGRERGQDRARLDRPARGDRVRPRLPRPHEPDHGDDGEARLQAELRAARAGGLPRARAVPVPRRHDRGRARRARAALQAGRRPAVGRVHGARDRAGRGRVHPDAGRVRAGPQGDLREARHPLRRRRGAVRLRPDRDGLGDRAPRRRARPR